MSNFKNITLKDYRRFLKAHGLHLKRTKGGHEHWWKEGLLRLVSFPNHVEPISKIVISNGLVTMGKDKDYFLKWLDEN